MTNDIRLNTVAIDQYAERALRSTSGRYRPIDTQSLVTRIIADLGLDATVESVSGRGPGSGAAPKSTKHAVVLTLLKPVILAGTPCFPRVYVRNSYDGESALTVRVGFYRLVCSNGMMIGTTHFNGRVLHLESGVKQLSTLRSSVVAAVKWCTDELPKLADRLNSVVLSSVQISTVLATIGASTRLADRVSYRILYPLSSLRSEDRRADGTLTAWNIWNIVNEVQRETSRSQLRQLEVNAKLLDAVEAVSQQAA